MVTDPFDDRTGKGLHVFSRGQYAFLPMGIKNGAGQKVAIDANFATFDSVVIITDPDGADVTSQWVTNALDPDDPDDDWDQNKDDNEGKYVGADHAPPYTGLFWDLFSKVAQKIKVPDTAEITDGNDSRAFHIKFGLRKNGILVAGTEEDFNVKAGPVPDFGTGPVSSDEVLRGISTSLDPASIELVISGANEWAEGWAEDCGALWDLSGAIPRTVRNAIINYARHEIFTYDQSAHKKVVRLREGDTSLQFSGIAGNDTLSRMYLKIAETSMERYCKYKGSAHRPRIGVMNIGPRTRHNQRANMSKA